jgi:hypothetical protein
VYNHTLIDQLVEKISAHTVVKLLNNTLQYLSEKNIANRLTQRCMAEPGYCKKIQKRGIKDERNVKKENLYCSISPLLYHSS